MEIFSPQIRTLKRVFFCRKPEGRETLPYFCFLYAPDGIKKLMKNITVTKIKKLLIVYFSLLILVTTVLAFLIIKEYRHPQYVDTIARIRDEYGITVHTNDPEHCFSIDSSGRYCFSQELTDVFSLDHATKALERQLDKYNSFALSLMSRDIVLVNEMSMEIDGDREGLNGLFAVVEGTPVIYLNINSDDITRTIDHEIFHSLNYRYQPDEEFMNAINGMEGCELLRSNSCRNVKELLADAWAYSFTERENDKLAAVRNRLYQVFLKPEYIEGNQGKNK